jgi:hypothetical protein
MVPTNSCVRSSCKSRSILTASTKGPFCGIGRISHLWDSSKSLRRSRRRCSSRRSTQIDGFVLLVDRSLGDRQGARGFPHEAFAELCKGMKPYSLDRCMMLLFYERNVFYQYVGIASKKFRPTVNGLTGIASTIYVILEVVIDYYVIEVARLDATFRSYSECSSINILLCNINLKS